MPPPARCCASGRSARRCGICSRRTPPPTGPRRQRAPRAHPNTSRCEINAEVERYEILYPDRAARIRAAGGMPADLHFGPPEPPIVAGLLRRIATPEGARLIQR